MAESNKSTTRINIGTLLFLIFLTLKLAGIGQIANWSWWWVTSPLWIPLAVGIAIIVIAVIIGVIIKSLK